jgi:hypothetical protein
MAEYKTCADLRMGLRAALLNRGNFAEFKERYLLTMAMVSAHGSDDPNLDGLILQIHLAFSDAGEGLYTTEEFRSCLSCLAQEPILEAGCANYLYFPVWVPCGAQLS